MKGYGSKKQPNRKEVRHNGLSPEGVMRRRVGFEISLRKGKKWSFDFRVQIVGLPVCVTIGDSGDRKTESRGFGKLVREAIWGVDVSRKALSA